MENVGRIQEQDSNPRSQYLSGPTSQAPLNRAVIVTGGIFW